MPFYQCLTPAGSLDADTRTKLARAITDVHSAVTGTPRAFVNVAFGEYPPNSYFTAGRPNTDASAISGTIRAGRDRETRAELLTQLSQAWTSITGQHARNLLIGLNEIDSTSAMEAGLIFPAPGEEEDWLARHSQELGELLSSE